MRLTNALAAIFKARWKEISIPVVIEFIVMFMGDFLQPRFGVVLGLFFIFLVISGICIYRIVKWISANKASFTENQNTLFDKNAGPGESVIKGTPIATFGLAISLIFLFLQLAAGARDFMLDQWHEYHLIADGNEFSLAINGKLVGADRR